MNFKRLQKLCKARGVTFYRLEHDLNLGNGVVAGWKTASPTVAKLKLVADYLGVTLDYLAEEDHDADRD